MTSNKSPKGAYTPMRVKDTTQRFQLFVRDLQESFWGDFQGRTREMLKRLLESDAEQQMAEYLGLKCHERARPAERVDYRNGFYERDYVTPLGLIRLRIPRTRQRSFLPRWIGRLRNHRVPIKWDWSELRSLSISGPRSGLRASLSTKARYKTQGTVRVLCGPAAVRVC